MLQVEAIPTATAPEALAGKERDHIMMTSEERRWTRRRARTAAGREIALALPTGTTLAPGALIAIEADWYLVVEAAAELVLAVRPQDRATAILVAFEVGNHHFPLALDGEDLLVPDDTAMVQLLTRLGISWQRRRAVFNPVARGHVHER